MPIDKKKRNFIITPNQFYSELSEETFRKICVKDVSKKLSYPLYLDFSNDKFQINSLQALRIMKTACVKELDISKNRFKEIDKPFEMFTRLKRLYASHNEIHKCLFTNVHSHLVLVDLSHNSLSSVPESLSQLVNLEYLDMSYNMISNGTETVTRLRGCVKLRDLNLSFNQLDMNKEKLDNFLVELKTNFKKLKSVNFDSNPFVMKLMNYRALFITRLQLTSLDGKEISSKERKSASQQGDGSSNLIQPLFFDEVGEQLKGTSRGLMKRVPSFNNLFSVLQTKVIEDEPIVEEPGRRATIVEAIKEQTHFDKINEVLENTSQIYLLVAGQKLLRTMKQLLSNISDISMKLHADDPNTIGLTGYVKFIELLKGYITRDETHTLKECFIRCLVTSFGFYTRTFDNATREEVQALTELGKFLFWNNNTEILRTTNQALHQFILAQSGKYNQQPIANLCTVLKYFDDYDPLSIPKISTPQELNRLSMKLKQPLTVDDPTQRNSPSYLIPNFSDTRRRSSYIGPVMDEDLSPSANSQKRGGMQNEESGNSLLATAKTKKLQGITKFYQEFMTNQFKSFSSNMHDIPNEILQLQIQSTDLLVKTFNFTDAMILAMTESDFLDTLMEIIIKQHKEFMESPTKPTTLQPQVQRYILLLKLFVVMSSCAEKFSGKIITLTEHLTKAVYFVKPKTDHQHASEEVVTTDSSNNNASPSSSSATGDVESEITDQVIEALVSGYGQSHFASCLGVIQTALASVCHVSKIKDDMFKQKKFMDLLLSTLKYFLNNGITTMNIKQISGALESIDTLLTIYHYKMVKHQTQYVTSSRTLVRAGDNTQMTDESYRLQGMQVMINMNQIHDLQDILLRFIQEETLQNILINPVLGVPLVSTVLHLIQMLPLLNINKHLEMVNDPKYCALLQQRLLEIVLLNTNTSNATSTLDNENNLLSVSSSLELNRIAASCFISVIRETNIEKDLLKKVVTSISTLSREAGYRGTKLNHSFELSTLLGILSYVKKEELLSEYKDVLLIQLLKIIQQLTVDLSTKQLYYNLIDHCIRLLRVLQPTPPSEQLDFEQFGKLFILITKQEQQIERENPQLYSIEAFEENASFNGIGVQISQTSSRNQTLTVESLPLFANQYIILLKCISELEISSFVCLRVMIRLVGSLESLSPAKLEKEFMTEENKSRLQMVTDLLKNIISLVSKPVVPNENESQLSSKELKKIRRKSLRKSISMSTRSFETMEAVFNASNETKNATEDSRRNSLRMKKRSSLRANPEDLSHQFKQPNYVQMLNYGMFDQYSANYWNERTLDLSRQLYSMVIDDVTSEWTDELKNNPFKLFNPFFVHSKQEEAAAEEKKEDDLTLSSDSDLSDISSLDSEDEDNGAETQSQHIRRIHRKSGTNKEFVDLLLRKKQKDHMKREQQQANPLTTMWSFYDDSTHSFSANDFYRLVFSDELLRDNVYDVITQSVTSTKISLSQLLSDKELKYLFIGTIGLRIINLMKLSEFGASQIIPLIHQVLSNTLFGSYRVNMLSVKILTHLLDSVLQKTLNQGTALRSVANNKSKAEAWKEVLHIIDQISQIIQQMNNTLRYRLQFHFSKTTPFSSDERHFLYNYVKLWHTIVNTIRNVPFHLLTDSKDHDHELLNELCQSQLLSFWVLPLPDFAVLLRLLYYHSITEHIPDSDDTRDNTLFGNLYRIQYLEELTLPLYSVTSDKQEFSGISLSNPHAQYMNQKRKLTMLLTEICGVYMRFDRFNLYNMLDFIVRLSPFTNESGSSVESSNSYYSVINTPSLRNSLLEQILKEESLVRRSYLLSKSLKVGDVVAYDRCTINHQPCMIVLFEKKIGIYSFTENVNTGKMFLSETSMMNLSQIESVSLASPYTGKYLLLKTSKEPLFMQFSNDTFCAKLISQIHNKGNSLDISIDWRLFKSLQHIFASGVDEQLLFFSEVLLDMGNGSGEKKCCLALSNYAIYFVNEKISSELNVSTSTTGVKSSASTQNLVDYSSLIEKICQFEINELWIDYKSVQQTTPTTKVKLNKNLDGTDNSKALPKKESIYCTFASDFAKISFIANLSAYQSSYQSLQA
ncbi:hypothetical protein C9374_010988 [Naegleria lovaniensis]|uniref:Leucine-rich repeat-containing protein n=1 Tax=Naegleria lovaniensis TaxID=51637 RepID=A0AA88KFK2_NAELO|nr:uncharacterized protein C9374_010988 [Naegleria lovaniensis]KAG2374151.1 hypothetical protein C9374_010988 [Naegleria lovaniensis]